MSDSPTPVALVDKSRAAGIPVTSSSQTATTTFITENGKETKVNTYTEQGSNSTGNDPLFVLETPHRTDGYAGLSSTNGLLANGSADPSELRLLSHEHH